MTARRVGAVLLLVLSVVVTVAVVVLLTGQVLAGAMATWVLGRAAGVAAYTMLVALVSSGLVLAHPWARHLTWPAPRTRLTVHLSLATFTAVFTVTHAVVLALDPWAGVGWIGTVVPFASTYRPVPVALGVIAVWSGLVTGLTARFAGAVGAKVWWPVHKVAAVALLLVWAHGIFAGSDVTALTGFYTGTGAAVVALAWSRYLATPPAGRSVTTAELRTTLPRTEQRR